MIVILMVMVDEEDRPLIAELYERNEKQLYLLAYDILGDHHEAQDCVQDTFEAAARRIETYRARSEDSRVYLLRTACRNLAIDRYRKRKRRPTVVELEEDGGEDGSETQLADPDEDLFADLVRCLTREKLVELIRSLPAKYREVIVLRFYESMSIADMAAHLGVAPKTVHNRLGKAYEILREKGGEELHELYYHNIQKYT